MMNATILQHATSPRRGVTLVELMVVIAIIALVATIALPAIGPMMQSKREAEFVNSLNGLFSMAQISALGKRSPVAIRFERAFETEGDTGLMSKTNNQANWQNYQQARFLDYAPSANDMVAFVHDPESKVHVFPSNFWVAPGDFAQRDLTGDENNTDMWYKTGNTDIANYSPFDTFYIVFNGNGELTRKPAGECNYRDRSQAYEKTVDGKSRILQPLVRMPTTYRSGKPISSPTSLVLYDRRAFEQVPATDEARTSFLQQYGRAIYLNRYNAAVVEGRR